MLPPGASIGWLFPLASVGRDKTARVLPPSSLLGQRKNPRKHGSLEFLDTLLVLQERQGNYAKSAKSSPAGVADLIFSMKGDITYLLYLENYPLRTYLEGEIMNNRFGFSIPLQTIEGKFLGNPFDDSQTSSSVAGETFAHTIEGGFEHMILLIDHAKLLRIAEQASLSPDALGALVRGRKGSVLKTRPLDIRHLRQRCASMLDAVRGGTFKMTDDAFETAIIDSILPVIDGVEYSLDRHYSNALVRRAIDFADSICGPIRISELSVALNASPRTLEIAFSRIMGVGPHAFFRKRRMNRARMMLLKADSRESRVTEIAEALGFSELGRFSVQYRELFGESPSETLRRSMRITVAVPWR